MASPNGSKFTVELASMKGGYISNLNKTHQAVPEISQQKYTTIVFVFSSSFCILVKILRQVCNIDQMLISFA